MAPPLLDVRRLRVDFPGITAVKSIDLQVGPGQAVALIGPNGSGKTTTMRAIAGLKLPTCGAISICGHSMDTASMAAKSRLGYMPDFSPIYDKLTVVEFLEHYALAYGVEGIKTRIRTCLELTGLSEKGNAFCKGLSRGMRQRLIIAKTLLHDPEFLMLDEPASGLDPIGRSDLKKIILKLREGGKGVLISSHILTELSAFCNHVAIMEKGKVRFFGPVDGLHQEIRARKWVLKWRDSGRPANDILSASEAVSNLMIDGLTGVFDISPETDKQDRLLKELIEKGVRVRQWGPFEDDIETIYFASGTKELS
jgi:ABC-2 type transport system ATP-binding protein